MPTAPATTPAADEDGPELGPVLAAAAAGDAGAFETLYRRFAPVVHGIALARVGRTEADDVVQETFVALHRGLGRLRDPRALPGWLRAVATNAANDRWRRRRRRGAPEALDLGEGPAAPEACADGDPDLRRRVWAGLGLLPEAYREALVWRLVEGLSGPEIAARTGLTPASVRVHLCRGMALLRAEAERRIRHDGRPRRRPRPLRSPRAQGRRRRRPRARDGARPGAHRRVRGAGGPRARPRGGARAHDAPSPRGRGRGAPRARRGRSRLGTARRERRGSPGIPPAAPSFPDTSVRPVARVQGDDGRTLEVGTWVEAQGAARSLDLGAYGRVTLADGARVQVAHVGQETTRLFLERGSLEARITLEARPRFFQVDTSAARCVDLGCHYVLSVDAAGAAHVRVTSGQVAFQHEGREVLVPSGATCVARPVGGPGTPRFADVDPALETALDAFDAAPLGPERTRLGREALARARTARDLLPAWHCLADPDAEVARAALEALYRLGSRPDGYLRPTGRPGPADQAAWKELLASQW